jgi:hypothetical protein
MLHAFVTQPVTGCGVVLLALLPLEVTGCCVIVKWCRDLRMKKGGELNDVITFFLLL